MWKNFETSAAEGKIKDYFQHDNWFIKLMAINYLFYVDNREPFIDAVNELNDHCRKAKVEKSEKQRLKYVSTSCIIFFEILEREAQFVAK